MITKELVERIRTKLTKKIIKLNCVSRNMQTTRNAVQTAFSAGLPSKHYALFAGGNRAPYATTTNPIPAVVEIPKTALPWNTPASAENLEIIRFKPNAVRTDGGPVDTSHPKARHKLTGMTCANLTKKPVNGIPEVAVADEKKLINGKDGVQYVTGTYSRVLAENPTTFSSIPDSEKIVKNSPVIVEVFNQSLLNDAKKCVTIISKKTQKPDDSLQKTPPKQAQMEKKNKTKITKNDSENT